MSTLTYCTRMSHSEIMKMNDNHRYKYIYKRYCYFWARRFDRPYVSTPKLKSTAHENEIIVIICIEKFTFHATID